MSFSLQSNMSHYERLAREAQDEKIAQLLMEAEKKKIEEERLAIQRDLEFARKLQEEDQAERVKTERARKERDEGEKERIAKAEQQRILLEQQKLLQEQQKRVQEQKDREVARLMASEDERKQRDLDIARRVQEENLRKKQQQEREDADLARMLQTQLNLQPVASVRSSYPPITYNNNNYNNSPITPNNVVNAHTQQVHRQFCGCAKTNSWDSNHIFKVHTAHCSCISPYVGTYSNEGAIHQHTRKCCKKNHVHNVNCHCDYRSHAHTYACCNKFHVHNQYCHCTHK